MSVLKIYRSCSHDTLLDSFPRIRLLLQAYCLVLCHNRGWCFGMWVLRNLPKTNLYTDVSLSMERDTFPIILSFHNPTKIILEGIFLSFDIFSDVLACLRSSVLLSKCQGLGCTIYFCKITALSVFLLRDIFLLSCFPAFDCFVHHCDGYHSTLMLGNK